MAKGTEVAEKDTAEGVVIGYADSDEYNWQTVHTEAADQIVFEEHGDKYIGVYAGHEIIYPDRQKDPQSLKYFVQIHWTDPSGAKFTNAGHELSKAYVEIQEDADGRILSHTDRVPLGSLTRNELMKHVDTGKNDLMKSYRVDIAVPRNADNPA